MKKFNREVLRFTLLFLITIFSGFLINYLLINNSKYFKLSQNINTIIMGHSHPECAYNDSLIYKSKNLAQSGEAYFYTYLKLKKLISENNQIKTILLEFEPSEIDSTMDTWTWGDNQLSVKFAIYSPLLDYPEFQLLWEKNSSAILTYFPKTFIKTMWDNLFNILVENKNIESDNQYGGYNFLKRDKMDSLLNTIDVSQNNLFGNIDLSISMTNIQYLTKIINYCKQKGVNIFLIRSPMHKTYRDINSEIKFRKILNTYFSQTEFLDFKDFPLRNDQYGDFEHLNFKGAKPYSIFFDQLLKMNLLKKDNKQAFIDSEIAKVSD